MGTAGKFSRSAKAVRTSKPIARRPARNAAPAVPAPLTPEQCKAMRAVAYGADVFAYGIASRLREVQAAHPKYIEIVSAMGRYDPVQQLPYFGAILTKAGRKAIK